MTGSRDAPIDRLGRAWAVPESPKPTTGEPLSRDRIVAAALELVDAEGVEALSMRRLANQLDAGATSLYWHVGGKEQLLDLVLDEVLGEVEAPASGSWRQRLEGLAWQLRVVLRRHRDVARLYGLRPAVGPNALGILEYVLATLRDAGLGDTLLPQAYGLLLGHVSGFAQQESTLAASAGASGQDSSAVSTALGGYLAGLAADRYPHLVAIAPAVSHTDSDERFGFGIARILDGLDSAIAGGEAGVTLGGPETGVAP